jgi:FAD/FMN-containing dehydrogenase
MSPLCIFRPTSTMDVSNGIKALANEGMEFAVRGGGHMSKKVSFSFVVFIQ